METHLEAPSLLSLSSDVKAGIQNHSFVVNWHQYFTVHHTANSVVSLKKEKETHP